MKLVVLRFNNQHKRLLKLINDFNLDLKKSQYHPICFDHILRILLKIFHILINLLIKKVLLIFSSHKRNKFTKTKDKISYRELINHSLLDLVDKKLDSEYPGIKKVFECIFEYWSEIAVLNSHDALRLFKNDFNSKIQFYILKTGLSEIINNLADYVEKHNVIIKKNCYLDRIIKDNLDRYELNIL